MAYQNVGTPRFYVDLGQYLQATGAWNPPSDFLALLNLNPASFVDNPSTAFIVPNTSTIRYLAILGHSGGTMYPEWRNDTAWFGTSNLVQIINGQGYSSNQSVSYSGFTIWTFDDEDAQSATGFKAVSSGEKGAISIGNYYDMPNAPNLSLTMSRDYGGTKEFTTHSGSSMSNTMWSKPPKWGDLGAWELGSGNPALSRSGRRSWDLKFSYMADSDLWGSNQSLSFLDVANNTEFDYNLLTDDNFFSQVWHKTLGGTLPFIFQPDNSNNNPDQFAICKFKDNSLKATQSAFNVYDISLSIEEVW